MTSDINGTPPDMCDSLKKYVYDVIFYLHGIHTAGCECEKNCEMPDSNTQVISKSQEGVQDISETKMQFDSILIPNSQSEPVDIGDSQCLYCPSLKNKSSGEDSIWSDRKAAEIPIVSVYHVGSAQQILFVSTS